MNWKALKYTLPIVIYTAAVYGFTHKGWWVWSTIIIAWVLVPLLEVMIKPDQTNMDLAQEEISKKDVVYDWLIYLIVPLQYISLALFLITITDPTLTTFELAGRITTLGMLCGTFGINVGHELGHRIKPFEQFLAKSLLLTSLYTHFFIEHNRGHHKNVATPHDPSSAPYGMWLYAFHARSMYGVYRDAWRIANAEMKKQGLPILHWKNEMLQLQILQLGFIAAIGVSFGLFALVCFLMAAFIGAALLETVNYIEHYGLSRKPTTPGNFERAQPQHSWNSNQVVGRLLLFELSRHSDHHYLASRKYQILRHHDEAPQLPTGYPGSMLLATIPPLWIWVMDRQMARYGIKP